MKVFVIGGTGAVGRPATRALVAAGHEVVGTARSAASADRFRRDGGEPATVSVFDVDALTAAFDGADAVVNLATSIPPVTRFMRRSAWAANDRLRIQGSACIVDAALAAGVERVVQESVVMVYPDGGDEWIDETTEPERYPLAEANLAAEASARRFTAAGGTGIVLRFGWFYGPGAAHSEQFFAIAKRHVCVQMGRPTSYVSSIHMADAGSAVVAALSAPAGIYNVVDDQPLTTRGYADALASAAGKRCWLRYPGTMALLLGNRTTSLTRSVRATNRSFRQATGWEPVYPSALEGWRATARAIDRR